MGLGTTATTVAQAMPGVPGAARVPIEYVTGKLTSSLTNNLVNEALTTIPDGTSFTKILTYPAANLDTSAATLTVRERKGDPRKPLPASSWSYIDAKHVRITTAPGFGREALYELIYPATYSIVEGIAFASIRDFVLFLRYAERDSTGQPNPVHPATPFKAVLGIGVSQSGRLSKDMVYQGFNVDGSGHMVFDGLLNVVSGAGRTDMNKEFSQPGRVSRQHEDHSFVGDQFPFTYSVTKDAASGKSDGLRVKCSQSHSCPKIFHIAREGLPIYIWRGGRVVEMSLEELREHSARVHPE